jgi:GH15 family glucan-1,4-alpha-glucosidase
MADLLQQSIDIILSNQHASGAYIACPNFPTYHYSWFRDGSFIAYAMDIAGRHASAALFHQWAADAINRRSGVVRNALELAALGAPLIPEAVLHTRYTLSGEEAAGEAWPNFQLDGFGTWLWSMAQHLRMSGTALPEEWGRAAGLVAQYLAALWQRPCYDCWEEFPDQVHTHTLAAVYGGLSAHASLTGARHEQALQAIGSFLENSAAGAGYFVKYAGDDRVDASLIGLSTPYRVVAPQDPRMSETVARIERTLYQGGGLHRYIADTYYGGGEWVLLAGWLGWYYAETGQIDKACSLLTWMESQADELGRLPEQTPAHLIDPGSYDPWVKRWGPVATPLLWSHAMYIVLRYAVDERPVRP